jgi:S-adenosylhomocysteine hydrolase
MAKNPKLKLYELADGNFVVASADPRLTPAKAEQGRKAAEDLRRSMAAATKELSRTHTRNEKTRRKIDRVQGETDKVLARLSVDQ